MFLCRVITIKFYRFVAAFLFFKGKKLKKLVCNFEDPLFPYCFKYRNKGSSKP